MLKMLGINFTDIVAPLLALCGALGLVLNNRNQDLSRLIRAVTEELNGRGESSPDEARRLNLRKQLILFRERISVVGRALQFTYAAGLLFVLMACFHHTTLAYLTFLSDVLSLLGAGCLGGAFVAAFQDMTRFRDTLDLEIVSAYPDFPFTRVRRGRLNYLLSGKRRPSLLAKIAQRWDDLMTSRHEVSPHPPHAAEEEPPTDTPVRRTR